MNEFDGYVEYYRQNYRKIHRKDVLINRRTPVGEPALFYERKPFGGKREFDPLLDIQDGSIRYCFKKSHDWDHNRWEFYLCPELKSFLIDSQIEVCEYACDGTFLILTGG
ncbi:MAG: hypothetical protein GF411_02905 [Candidatus Lokiarchaeota archaeon]|nr:hypothetical protein [Candidatus Lokiarchaeota archaeon]